jgi:hypothetical protein
VEQHTAIERATANCNPAKLGATWDQNGEATGHRSGEQACADYLAQIERAERHAAAVTDTRSYWAVLDNPKSTPVPR